MYTMSSAHRSMSEMMCVEKKTATPVCLIWSKSPRSSSRENGSRPLVGSSRMRASAPWERANRRLHFTFMPSESSCGVLPSSSANVRR